MIGIIGTGWGARIQVPAFRAAGLQISALAGQDGAKTARIAAELGVPFATDDWRRLIVRSDVEIVSIVAPPALHAEMAGLALAAGKHVLCEKPTALDAAEAEQMAAAAAAQPHLLALIDHELRFLPAIAEARRLISSGAVGEPRSAFAHGINNSRRDPSRPWSWWADRAQGGGLLGALGSHQVDTLRYLLSDEVRHASGLLQTSIAARPTDDGTLKPATSDDGFVATLQFTRGTLATINSHAAAGINEPFTFMIYGSDGALRCAGGRLWLVRNEQLQEVPLPAVEYPAVLSTDFPRGTLHLGHALAAAVNGDEDALAPAATFADGLANQRVLDAIRASSDAAA
jgi:predicted dehydrogenase